MSLSSTSLPDTDVRFESQAAVRGCCGVPSGGTLAGGGGRVLSLIDRRTEGRRRLRRCSAVS
ncbi:hypothetical protein E2C01_060969 [Portunus trituberculatus]|uniref:Uncharacterized protein n=1 Tax=Portunus trituberculatus TaxID=210409 RepID=A0A5B7HA46_PORTR|nr:hypothetical protein [Portunus trituberculatus]